MASRRVPESVRAELPRRAHAGLGLDGSFPTILRTGQTVPAAEACKHAPSEQCVQMLNAIQHWLVAQGVGHLHIVTDLRGYGQPGTAAIIWGEGPTAHDVAQVFATDWLDDLPRIPAWMALKAEHEFDLRWQPPY